MKISSVCPVANYLPCSIQTSRLLVTVTLRHSSSDMLESHDILLVRLWLGN